MGRVGFYFCQPGDGKDYIESIHLLFPSTSFHSDPSVRSMIRLYVFAVKRSS